MEKRALLILGAGTMQVPAIEAARRIGLESHVVDADPGAPGAALADRFEVIDLKDPDAIAAYGMNVPGLAGVFTAGTDFSASVAQVAETLGLPGVPLEVALDASSKERMRARFAAKGVPSPAYKAIYPGENLEKELPEAERLLRLPVVVKPVDNMGARGVRRLDDFRELAAAVEEARAYARGGVVICEELIDGQEFSVDALVYRGEITVTGVAERHIYFEPYFVEMGHTLPAELSEDSYRTLIDTFGAGVRALGIDNGAAKGDVFLRRDGTGAVGEIAARLSGGYMSGWTYPYATDVPLTEAGIRLALGEDPRPLLRERAGRTSAERAFISIPGRVASLDGLQEVREMEEVREIFLRVSPGERVAPPRNNVEKCGNIIVVGENREAALSAARRALQRVCVRLEPAERESDRYLFDLSLSAIYAWFPRLAEETRRELLGIGSEPLAKGVRELVREIRELGAIPWRLGNDDLGKEEHWPPFTPKEAVEKLLSEGVATPAEGSPGVAETLIKRILALGGVQGAVYIRESALLRAEDQLERWTAILLEGRS